MDSVERAVNLDSSANLIAVCTQPVDQSKKRTTAVVLINAGLLHRVGPNRMNTLLARRLASLGFITLRMDLSGLGDSSLSLVGDNDFDRVALDLDKAFSHLKEEFSINQFILLGLCSGAYDTSRKAVVDNRIVGLVNIDGVGYRTPRFYINHVFLHLLRRVWHTERWKRLYRRYQAKKSSGAARYDNAAGSVLMNTQAYTDWTRDEAGAHFETLAKRGVRMYFVYTGGVSGYYNYHGQFDDIFKNFNFDDMASSQYFPNVDHLAMLEAHRNRLHENIATWVDQTF